MDQTRAKEILAGVISKMFPEQEIEDEAKRRLFICLLPDGPQPHCRHYNPNEDGYMGPKCDGCGCFLKYKSRSIKSKCPLNKWEIK
jgi:hypothetical protein